LVNLRHLLTGIGIASAGILLYGSLVEANRLVLRRVTLKLPDWPPDLSGYRIGLVADFHLRDFWTVEHAIRAGSVLSAENPNMTVIAGDFVGRWKEDSVELIDAGLSLFEPLAGRVLAVPGNHDYYGGDPEILIEMGREVGIRLLRNEVVRQDGIQWLGIDSQNGGEAMPHQTFALADEGGAKIVIWHEPDMVDHLPGRASLMLSGHSHGGQFLTPWGWPPIRVRNGRKYLRGFFDLEPTPLYVTSGVGTTGPPSRLNCPPEVVLLTLESA